MVPRASIPTKPPSISIPRKSTASRTTPTHSHSCSPNGCPAPIHDPPPRPTFPLLSLPPEIVSQIVEQAVTDAEPLTIHEPRFNRHPSPPPPTRSYPKLDRKVPPTSPGIPEPKIRTPERGLQTPPASRGASPSVASRLGSPVRVKSPIQFGEDPGQDNSKDDYFAQAQIPSRQSSKRISHPHDHNDPTSTSPRRSRATTSTSDSRRQWGHTLLALPLSSRALYIPNWQTYYINNTFLFSTLDIFLSFATTLPKRCLNRIQNIVLKLPRKHRHDIAWQTLAKLKDLKELEIWLKHAGTIQDADCGEWEGVERGVKGLHALELFTLRREPGDDNVETNTPQDSLSGPNSETQADDTSTPAPAPTPGLANHNPNSTSQNPDHGPSTTTPEDAQNAEDVSPAEQVLRRDRQLEARINIFLKERLDRRASLRRRQAERIEDELQFPGEESDG